MVGKLRYVKQVIGNAAHDLTDFIVGVVVLAQPLEMVKGIAAHIGLDVHAHHMAHIRHKELRRRVHQTQHQIEGSFLGRSDSSKIEVASDSYRTSDYIPVKGGDVLYFGAAVKSQGYQLTLFGADKKPLTNVKIAYMVEYADLGDGLAIYAYSMPHDAAYVRVVAATSVYDAGKQLATINQPFDAEGYNNFFNPPETTEPAPETTKPAEPVPTGDSALIFAAIAIISLAGVAVVAKRREN